jgi:hypothetical protein
VVSNATAAQKIAIITKSGGRAANLSNDSAAHDLSNTR